MGRADWSLSGGNVHYGSITLIKSFGARGDNSKFSNAGLSKVTPVRGPNVLLSAKFPCSQEVSENFTIWRFRSRRAKKIGGKAHINQAGMDFALFIKFFVFSHQPNQKEMP